MLLGVNGEKRVVVWAGNGGKLGGQRELMLWSSEH